MVKCFHRRLKCIETTLGYMYEFWLARCGVLSVIPLYHRRKQNAYRFFGVAYKNCPDSTLPKTLEYRKVAFLLPSLKYRQVGFALCLKSYLILG